MGACSRVTSIWTNEGFDGTPANDRWLSDEYLAMVFPKSEAIAKLMALVPLALEVVLGQPKVS